MALAFDDAKGIVEVADEDTFKPPAQIAEETGYLKQTDAKRLETRKYALSNLQNKLNEVIGTRPAGAPASKQVQEWEARKSIYQKQADEAYAAAFPDIKPRSWIDAGLDVTGSAIQGILGSVEAATDLLAPEGYGSTTRQYLGKLKDAVGKTQSREAKARLAEVDARTKAAENSGVLAQLNAGWENFKTDPGHMIGSAAGSMVTVLPALAAAPFGAIPAVATGIGSGVIVGLGSFKQQAGEKAENKAKELGATDAQALQLGVDASAINGDNYGQAALAGVLGAADNVLGVGGAFLKSAIKKPVQSILNDASKPAAGTIKKSFVTGGTEAGTEISQALNDGINANRQVAALDPSVSPTQGVFIDVASSGITGFAVGNATGAATRGRPTVKIDHDLFNEALKVAPNAPAAQRKAASDVVGFIRDGKQVKDGTPAKAVLERYKELVNERYSNAGGRTPVDAGQDLPATDREGQDGGAPVYTGVPTDESAGADVTGIYEASKQQTTSDGGNQQGELGADRSIANEAGIAVKAAARGTAASGADQQGQSINNSTIGDTADSATNRDNGSQRAIDSAIDQWKADNDGLNANDLRVGADRLRTHLNNAIANNQLDELANDGVAESPQFGELSRLAVKVKSEMDKASAAFNPNETGNRVDTETAKRLLSAALAKSDNGVLTMQAVADVAAKHDDSFSRYLAGQGKTNSDNEFYNGTIDLILNQAKAKNVTLNDEATQALRKSENLPVMTGNRIVDGSREGLTEEQFKKQQSAEESRVQPVQSAVNRSPTAEQGTSVDVPAGLDGGSNKGNDNGRNTSPAGTEAAKATDQIRGAADVGQVRQTATAGRGIDNSPRDTKPNNGTTVPAIGGGGKPDVAVKQMPSVGIMPNTAEPVSVKNGVVHIGNSPAINYDTGNDITVSQDATPDEVKKALKDGGALSAKQRFFDAKPEAKAYQKPLLSVSTNADTEFAYEVLNELSQYDEAFRYPITNSGSLEENIANAMPAAKMLGDATRVDEKQESGADKRTLFRAASGADFYVYERGRDVWLDVSRLNEGDQGSAIYHGVANYAHNAKKIFVGDPAGLSEAAVIARSKAMLASSMRFGTTAHFDAATEQIAGDVKNGIPPLEWNGSDYNKVQSLIKTVVGTLQNKFPAIKGYKYDFSQGIFTDQRGRPVSRERLELGANSGYARASRAGTTSLRQGIFIQSLMASESGQRPTILEQFLRGAVQLAKSPELKGILSQQQQATQSPTTTSTLWNAWSSILGGIKDAQTRLKQVKVWDNWAQVPDDVKARLTDATGNAQAFYDPKTEQLHFIADRIEQGHEKAVILHEAFHKWGEKVLGKETLQRLHDTVQGWSKKPEGSVERQVFEAADKRAKASDNYQAEFLTYAIEEADIRGITPDMKADSKTVSGWLARVKEAFGRALNKLDGRFSVTNDLSVNDLVSIAYGAAQMELPSNRSEMSDGNNGDFSPTNDSILASVAATPAEIANGKQLPSVSPTAEALEVIKGGKDSIKAYGGQLADKLNEWFGDYQLPFIKHIQQMPITPAQQMGIIGGLERATNIQREMNLSINKQFRKPLSLEIQRIAKETNQNFETVYSQVSTWMTAKYAPDLNAWLVKKDEAALSEAKQKLEDDPSNNKLILEVNKATKQLSERKQAVSSSDLSKGTKANPHLTGVGGNMNDAQAADYAAKIERMIPADDLEAAAKHVYDMLTWKKSEDINSGKLTSAIVNKFPNSKRYVPTTGDPRSVETDDVFSGGGLNQGKDKSVGGRTSSEADAAITAAFESVGKTTTYSGYKDFKQALNVIWEDAVQYGVSAGKSMPKAIQDAHEQLGYKRANETVFNGMKDDAIVFRQGNDNYVFSFDDASIVKGLQRETVEKQPAIIAAVAKAPIVGTQAFGKILTVYNPIFPPLNQWKDVLERSELIRTKQVLDANGDPVDMNKVARAMLVFAGKNVGNSYAAVAGKAGQDYTTLLDEFIKNGGSSTYGDFLARSQKDLITEMKRDGKWTRELDQFARHYSDSFEQLAGVSAYKALLDAGVDEKTAAATSLSLMNFNKTGSKMAAIRGLFVFAQPIVTGGAVNLVKYAATPTGAKRLVGLAVLSLVLQAMLQGLGGDDESGKEIDRQGSFTNDGNIVIPLGNGKIVKIPVPYGPHKLAWSLAHNIRKWATGEHTATETIGEVAKNLVREISPVQPNEIPITKYPADFVLQSIMPTTFKPLAMLGTNRNQFGSVIIPDYFKWEKDLKSATSKLSTPKEYDDMAAWIQRNTGIDMYPDHIKAVVDYYAVGIFKELGTKPFIDNPNLKAQGKDAPMPFLSRLYAPSSQYATFRNFTEYQSEGNALLNDYKAHKDSSNPQAYSDEEKKMMFLTHQADQHLGTLRTQKAGLTRQLNAGKITEDEYFKKLDEVSAVQDRIQRSYIYYWRKVEGRPTEITKEGAAFKNELLSTKYTAKGESRDPPFKFSAAQLEQK